METLKLEHIAPYLHYGLQIKVLNHECDYVGIEYSVINGYYFLGDSLHVTYNGGSTGKSVSEFKPILRPLSDFDNSELKKYWDKEHIIEFRYGKRILLNIDSASYIDLIGYPLELIIQLLENHFDIFGLIDKGLAIDINTLNK